MKKLFLKIILLLSIVIVLASCRDEISVPPASIKITFYDTDNKLLWGKNLINKVEKNYLENLKIKIIPSIEKSKKVEINYTEDKRILTPLDMNEITYNIFNDTKKMFGDYKSRNIEEFTYTLVQNEQEIFNKEFQLFYKQGNPFKMVAKKNYKNSEGKWVKYTSKKIEITKNGKGTGIFYKIEFR